MNIKRPKGLENTFLPQYTSNISHIQIPKVWDFLFERTLSYGVMVTRFILDEEFWVRVQVGQQIELKKRTKNTFIYIIYYKCPGGGIGNTSDSGSEVPGSSPGGTTRGL